MLFYRFHNFPVAADAPLGTTLARVKECLGKAGVRNAPLRFYLYGPRGCADIVARFPELRRFLSTAGPQSGGEPVEHLSNFGPSAPGAFAGPAGEVKFETIAEVVAGIPQEFSISSADVVLGPILEGTTALRSPHLHSPPMEMTLQSISLGWQSSPTRDGRRYFLSFNEPLPTAAPRQPVPPWIETLYSAFPGATAEKISSDVDQIMMEYRMVVSGTSGSFIGSKSIGNDLKLPHELPDWRAVSQLEFAPLRGVRGTIARMFADDGWKEASGSGKTRIHELRNLRKTSPGGRRLGLRFWIRKRGRLSRSISAVMELVAERRNLTLGVMAERSTRHEYEVPNSEVMSQILDNTRVVVKYLEKTWITELEEALGPRRQNSKIGNR